ncbi:BAG domain-containing protein Samui isoform X3 [Nilaparvata lugens]|uniref:BAG domain-containing protein Samui isoform X3 n=1 Tax=Nilaparvata lugens TaxID=108931 RepID=UPI00193CC644|nr:BAG domain-containing protein Samui isoform X3 [Nilaparvata lugens]
MDASSPLMMDGGGSSAMPPKAYYFGDDVMDFGGDVRGFNDDVRDFDDFQRHMFSDDDDLPPSTRGRSSDLRSHLEDLANRHPEFADHLRSPPGWVSDLRGGKWSGGARSSSRDRPFFEGQAQAADTSSQGHEEPSQSGEEASGGSGLSQHGLRNTVPDINSQAASEVRNQRSMSAPPDSNRTPTPHRFVSKIEINPVNPATGQTAADSKPPVPPSSKPQQSPNMQQQPQHKTSTVRHIPIFVEGRDEPILPKNVDQEYNSVPQPQQQQQWQQPQQQFTTSHQFQPQRKPSSQGFQQQFQQQSASPPPPPQQQMPRPRDQTDSGVPQQQQQQQQQQPEQPKVDVNDPIYKVQLIQKEVDALRQQIEAFSGKTRADKEFIYLDEMLTRNLLKLDNISTEGKENIRAVRKEAINSVQKCISLLESKVDQQKMDVDIKGEDEVVKEGGEEEKVEEATGGAGGSVSPPKEEGPVEKVPKTDSQDNPNEIKC